MGILLQEKRKDMALFLAQTTNIKVIFPTTNFPEKEFCKRTNGPIKASFLKGRNLGKACGQAKRINKNMLEAFKMT